MADKEINRREAIKQFLAAGGLVTAASFLPGKWIKPVIASGKLAPHAQASACPFDVPIYDWNSDRTGWTEINSICLTEPPFEGQTIDDDSWIGDDEIYEYVYYPNGVELYEWENLGAGFYFIDESPLLGDLNNSNNLKNRR